MVRDVRKGRESRTKKILRGIESREEFLSSSFSLPRELVKKIKNFTINDWRKLSYLLFWRGYKIYRARKEAKERGQKLINMREGFQPSKENAFHLFQLSRMTLTEI